MAITSKPEILGASLAVATTAELAVLPVDGMSPGTGVYNLETGSVWVLEINANVPGPGELAVFGITGALWIDSAGPVPGGFVTVAELASTDPTSGATMVGVNNPSARYSEPDLQHILDDDMVAKVDLAQTDGSGGASLVGIQDVGGYYSSNNDEGALQEIGASLALKATAAALATTNANVATNTTNIATNAAALAKLVEVPGSRYIKAMYDASNINGLNNAGIADGAAIGTWKNVAPTVPGGVSLGSGADLIQATAGAKPIYRATGGPNGTAALEGDGARDMASAAFTAFGQPMQLVVVFQPTDIAATYVWFSGNTGAAPELATTNVGRLSAYGGAGYLYSANSNVGAGQWHETVSYLNSTASQGDADGGLSPVGDAGISTCDGFTAFSEAGSFKAKGKLALVIVYWGVQVSFGEIDRYLAARFGRIPV